MYSLIRWCGVLCIDLCGACDSCDSCDSCVQQSVPLFHSFPRVCILIYCNLRCSASYACTQRLFILRLYNLRIGDRRSARPLEKLIRKRFVLSASIDVQEIHKKKSISIADEMDSEFWMSSIQPTSSRTCECVCAWWWWHMTFAHRSQCTWRLTLRVYEKFHFRWMTKLSAGNRFYNRITPLHSTFDAIKLSLRCLCVGWHSFFQSSLLRTYGVHHCRIASNPINTRNMFETNRENYVRFPSANLIQSILHGSRHHRQTTHARTQDANWSRKWKKKRKIRVYGIHNKQNVMWIVSAQYAPRMWHQIGMHTCGCVCHPIYR